MKNTISRSILLLFFLLVLSSEITMAQTIIPERFKEGEQVPFLGIFTHTEPVLGMDEKIESVKKVIADNPYISGVTIKIWWKDFHPEKEKIEWEKLEELVSLISSAGKYVNLAIWGGYFSPDWVYEDGCKSVVGPFGKTIIPWDKKYMELFTADIKAVAKRYANDPRIFLVDVMGHNFKGQEMHAPPSELFKDFGWSEETVFENWKYWIDLYDSLYREKKLTIVISQMYPGRSNLPGKVTDYFTEKCGGRAVLQTHQLNGREALINLSGEICKKNCSLAPNGHETVGSFKEQPERQGSPEMTIYKLRLLGNPMFVQMWRRDCDDPKYAKAVLCAWEKYKNMSVDEMKSQLMNEGLYVEKSDFQLRK